MKRLKITTVKVFKYIIEEKCIKILRECTNSLFLLLKLNYSIPTRKRVEKSLKISFNNNIISLGSIP